MMLDDKTLQLFEDLTQDRRAALAADIDAAGGAKTVGGALWPKLAPDTAARKIANVLNPKQAHELSDEEVWVIKQLARRATGKSHLVTLEAQNLGADVHWLTNQDMAERAQRRVADAMERLQIELVRAGELLRAVK